MTRKKDEGQFWQKSPKNESKALASIIYILYFKKKFWKEMTEKGKNLGKFCKYVPYSLDIYELLNSTVSKIRNSEKVRALEYQLRPLILRRVKYVYLLYLLRKCQFQKSRTSSINSHYSTHLDQKYREKLFSILSIEDGGTSFPAILIVRALECYELLKSTSTKSQN